MTTFFRASQWPFASEVTKQDTDRIFHAVKLVFRDLIQL
jgi:hypothetical protein